MQSADRDPVTRYSDCRPFVVDDDGDSRLLIARAFLKAGVPKNSLQLVADSEEAVRILTTMSAGPQAEKLPPPSLVVLDVEMPKLSGLEILARIRTLPALKETPIFMLSSNEDPSTVSRAFELRTDSYFVKPATFDALQSIVEGMLGFWHLRTQRRVSQDSIRP